jgi:hypothetical protein
MGIKNQYTQPDACVALPSCSLTGSLVHLFRRAYPTILLP